MPIENILYETIEKVLFNKDHLNRLKQLIKGLHDGLITPKELKAYILQQKKENVDKLLKLFPFYVRKTKMDDSSSEFARNPSHNKKLSELQDKDKFLEKIGIRVNYLVNKLSKKL